MTAWGCSCTTIEQLQYSLHCRIITHTTAEQLQLECSCWSAVAVPQLSGRSTASCFITMEQLRISWLLQCSSCCQGAAAAVAAAVQLLERSGATWLVHHQCLMFKHQTLLVMYA